jgi:colanic acid biosynthesis glycosyl transferase WcaI
VLDASRTFRARSWPPRRVAVHDYGGHPFQVGLSRELARRGHEVRHFYFAEDNGPKGNTRLLPGDPSGFSVEPISIGRSYSKSNMLRRRQADILYGTLASRRIMAFAPDIVISGNTPLEAQAPILKSAQRAGTAFVFWMQDFYSLAAARILRRKMSLVGSIIGAYYSDLEGRLLRRSDAIVLISDDFRQALQSLGVDDQVAEVIPNWGPLDELPMRPKSNQWAVDHDFSEKFVFLYSGTLALKHDPDLIWALAKHFEQDPHVLVAVTGAGVSFEALKTRCAAESVSNLVLLPLQPMDVFADVLGSADVLVALLEGDAGPFSVPSKVLAYLCAGRPILLSAPPDNLSARVLERAGAGLCIPPGARQGLVEGAERLRRDPRMRTAFGSAARHYAQDAFDISAIADRFEVVFAAAVSRRQGRRRK